MGGERSQAGSDSAWLYIGTEVTDLYIFVFVYLRSA
jgi:hypothetical protein